MKFQIFCVVLLFSFANAFSPFPYNETISRAIHRLNEEQCSKTKACPVKGCCSKWGNCGFGPDFCRNGCLRDCDAKPECGKYSDTKECPLKVCCSQYGFCGTTTDFCGKGCQNNCGNATIPGGGSAGNHRIGYYASWSSTRKCSAFSTDNIDPRNYTHLNYAFVTIFGGVVAPSKEESDKLKKFANLKLVNPNLKTLASVGGWAFNDPGPTRQEFHNIAKDSGSRDKFVKSVVAFLETHWLDGIDIDWEYPGAPDRGGFKEDTDNYVSLVSDLRKAFGTKYLITIAAPASYWYLRHFKPPEMAKHLDWINVMTYDFHGIWDKDSNSLGPYVRPHTDMKQIENAFSLFWKDGVPANKLVLGLGYYGRAFTLKDKKCNKIGCEFSGPAKKGPCTNAEGSLAWFEINTRISDDKLTPTYDKDTVSKILTWDDQWVAYDDELTLSIKTQWGRSHSTKGVMIWSIDQGEDRVKDDQQLPKMGTVTVAKFHMSPSDASGGKVAPVYVLDSESGRDSSVGFDAFSITGEKFKTLEESLKTPPGCGANQQIDVLGSMLAAWRLARLAFDQWNNLPADQIGSSNTLTINDNDNPIQMVERRLIGRTRRNQPLYRTELVQARVYARHIRDSRNDFNGDHIYQYLNGVRGMDDRGHIIQSWAGGPGGTAYYNLAPQYWRLNQHSVNDQDWVAMERTVRTWFGQNPLGYVDYYIILYYPPGGWEGRPRSWAWALRFSDGTELEGVVFNRDQSGTDVPRPGSSPLHEVEYNFEIEGVVEN